MPKNTLSTDDKFTVLQLKLQKQKELLSIIKSKIDNNDTDELPELLIKAEILSNECNLLSYEIKIAISPSKLM